MQQKKILVVDDEPSVVNLVRAYLEPEGYTVFTAMDGNAGYQVARSVRPDLIVLDIMLPGMDGIELLTRLRRELDSYVILLSAKTEETDKIIGLSVGADDYVTKPFSPRELVARIKSAFRRMQTRKEVPGTDVLVFEHLRIDPGSRQVWMDDQLVELTGIEFDLLYTLAAYQGLVLSREKLLERVWGYEYYGELRVVDVHIGHIRQKLGDEKLISTVRGVGYRFEGEVAR
jgi:two-component system alkaline phosphatase synthesis response regulator PhoP